jgi:hypothetical protein
MHRSNASLFDHLVGAGKQRCGDIETDCLSCPKIDDQLVFGRRLQVGWLLALKYAVDIAGRLSVLVAEIRTIGDQAAIGDEVTVSINHGKAVLELSGNLGDDD